MEESGPDPAVVLRDAAATGRGGEARMMGRAAPQRWMGWTSRLVGSGGQGEESTLDTGFAFK